MKREIRIFFTAIMFFTRLPCPRWVDHSEEYLTNSSRYFPLIGIIVGSIGAIVFYLSSFILPHPICVLLSMLSTIFVTGAFHEDGLADVCDGFGGGWKKEDILRIMKDSRVGAFGVIGIGFILALKFSCLYQMPVSTLPLILIAGHSLSRFAASILLYKLNYVRDDVTSKAKPAAQRISILSLVIGGFIGIVPVILFLNYYYFLLLIPVFLTTWYLGYYFQKWIGGQTGDCLGATQQICEVIVYLSVIVLWKFI